MIEHVGVIAIASAQALGSRGDASPCARGSAGGCHPRRVIRLRQASGLLAVLGAPFVAAAGLVYLTLLTGHDINFYLANQPPSWYLAIAIGVLSSTALGAALAVLYVGTIFAVPILLLEDQGVLAAIRASSARLTAPG